MKTKLCFCLNALFLYASAIVCGQNPVWNPSFENWTSGTPDGWNTFNNPNAVPCVFQYTPAHTGSFAVKGEVVMDPNFGILEPELVSTDTNEIGFPVSQLYSIFSFYYKFNQIGSGSFNANAGIVDINSAPLLFCGIQNIAPTSSYTLYSDSLLLFMPGGMPVMGLISFDIYDTVLTYADVGNYFVVDDVMFSNPVGIHENLPLLPKIEKLQPNPVCDWAYIYYSLLENSDLTFELFDVMGKKHKELILINEKFGRHKLSLIFHRFLPGAIFCV